MSSPITPPFADLTPDLILDAVEASGHACDGRLLALNSYENRVYQVGIESAPSLVAKFYRPRRWSDEAIDEEHRFVIELAGEEIPVVAPLLDAVGRTLQEHAGYRFALYPRQGGRPPEFESIETLEWMGRLLARIHLVGERSPFVARPALDVVTFGEEARDFVAASGFVPPELETPWRGVVDQAIAGEVRQLRLHGDCHAGNVLWTDRGPHFVDFDDCRSGPAIQDLWMLLAGDQESMTRQFSHVLRGYERFRRFDERELHLIEALRTLRLIHYSAWLARRWDDPAFPAAFPWFNTQRYWQDRILELREQIALMDEAPLSAVRD